MIKKIQNKGLLKSLMAVLVVALIVTAIIPLSSQASEEDTISKDVVFLNNDEHYKTVTIDFTDEDLAAGGKYFDPDSIPEDPSMNEMIFEGWSDGSNTWTGDNISGLFVVNDNSTVIMNSVYVKDEGGTVKFNEKNTDGINSSSVYYDLDFVVNGKTEKSVAVPESAVISDEVNSYTPNTSLWPEGATAFIGWYTTATGSTKFDFDKAMEKDVKVYAQFKYTYLINFADTNGDIIDSMEVYPNELLTETNAVISSSNGSKFEYWYYLDEDENEIIVDFGSDIATKDLTLSPKFNDQFYVLFISAGTQVETQYVNLNEKMDSVNSPTRNGYAFSGWALDEEGTKSFNMSSPVTSNLVLYAQWVPQTTQFKVVRWMEKANLSQGNVVIDNKQSNFQYVDQTTSSAKSGTFIENGAGITVAKVGSTSISQNAPDYTYYSHYTVSNGDTAVKGNGATVINVYYKRTVYKFDFDLRGLTSSITANPTMVIGGSTYTQTSNDSTCGYSFSAKMGESIVDRWPSAKNATFGQPKSNYNFLSWENGNSDYVTHRLYVTSDFLSMNVDNDTNTRKFQANYSNSVVSKTINYFMEISEEEYLSKYQGSTSFIYGITDGQTRYFLKDDINSQAVNASSGTFGRKAIDGYYKSYTVKSLSGQKFETSNLSTADAAGNVTNVNFIYLRDSYTLSFDTNGGSLQYGNRSMNYDDLYYNKLLDSYVSNVTPTRVEDGISYEFKGWYYEDNFITKFEKGDVMPSHNVCLYAKWETGDLELTLMESAKSENVLDKVRITTNDYVTDEVTGYVIGNYYTNQGGVPLGEFAGWLVKREDGKYYEFSSEIPIRDDTTLYATWVTDGFKVTYDQGESTTNVAEDINTYKLGTQARLSLGKELTDVDSKAFIGWEEIINGESTGIIYYPGSIYTVNCNVTMKAMFDDPVNYIKVTYHKNDGTNSKLTYYVKKDTEISLLTSDTFSRDGYKMEGWTTDKTGKELLSEGSFYKIGTSNVDFYAQWTAEDLMVKFTAEKGGSLKGQNSYKVTNPERGSEYEVAFGTITVPTPVPDTGYYFAGWKPSLPDDDSIIDKNVEYKATFAAKSALKIVPKELYKTYDGKEFKTTDDAIEGFNVEGLNEEHEIVSIKTKTSITDADVVDNVIDSSSIVIRDMETGETVNYRYDITLDTGILEIGKAKLTVTADSYNLYIRTAIPELTYTIDGFANKEDKSVIKTTPKVRTNVPIDNTAPGTFETIAYGASADNYSFTYKNGGLTYYIEGSVLYSLNGGNGNVPTDNNVYDEKNNTVQLKYGEVPTKAGCNFIGWSLDKDGSDIYKEDDKNTIDFMANVGENDSIILYAQYQADFSDFVVEDVMTVYNDEDHGIKVAGIYRGDEVTYKTFYGSEKSFTEIKTTSSLPLFTNANEYTTFGYSGNKIKIDVTVKRGTDIVIKSAYVTISQNPITVKVADAWMEYIEGETLYPTAVTLTKGTMIKDHTLDMTNAKFSGSLSTVGYSDSSVSGISIDGTHDENYDISYKEGVLAIMGIAKPGEGLPDEDLPDGDLNVEVPEGTDEAALTVETSPEQVGALIPTSTAYDDDGSSPFILVGAAASTGNGLGDIASQIAANAPAESTTITNTDVPLFGTDSGYWALINLLLALATAALFLVTIGMYLRKKNDDYENADTDESEKNNKHLFRRLLMLVPAIGSIILFILTEDMSLQMAMTDKWTVYMAVIFVIQAVIMVLASKDTQKDIDEARTV